MTKEFLEECLAEGLSLDQIAARAGKHPSTVRYHLKRHGLRAVHHEANSPRGSAISKAHLEALLSEGASLREIAEDLGLSVSTVRYWLSKHSLAPSGVGRARVETTAARRAGVKRLRKSCQRHGVTDHVLESRGYYRCLKCRSSAVSERRRRAKRELTDGAGGRCLLCGYSRYQGALQFHHLDPPTKRFAISRNGNTRNVAEVRAEAEKCVLLCANCHAEVEAGISSLPANLSLQ